MDFKIYLKNRPPGKGSIAKVIREASNPDFPNFTNPRCLDTYLRCRGASYSTRVAAARLWNDYRSVRVREYRDELAREVDKTSPEAFDLVREFINTVDDFRSCFDVRALLRAANDTVSELKALTPQKRKRVKIDRSE